MGKLRILASTAKQYEEAPDWVKPVTWVDLEYIVTSDSTTADSKVGVLLDNTDDSFTFTLVNAEGLTAVKFHDGTTYTGAGTYTHTFDPVDDIVNGYERQRWYILYFNGDIANRVLEYTLLLKNSVLWLYFYNQTQCQSGIDTTSTLNKMSKVQRIQAHTMGDIQFVAMSAAYLLRGDHALVSIDLDDTYDFSANFYTYCFDNCISLKRVPIPMIYNGASTGVFLGSTQDCINFEGELTVINNTTSTSETAQFSAFTYSPKLKKLNIYATNTFNYAIVNYNKILLLETIDLMNAQPLRFGISGVQSTYLINIKNLFNIDFTRCTYGSYFFPNSTSTAASYKYPTMKNITIVPNTLNISMRFEFTDLTEDSMWQIVNAFKDRSATTSLTLTVPLELYQKMTSDMLNALSAKNIAVATY